MRIVVVGATGTIGRAVADALAGQHEVLRASRQGPVRLDIDDPRSVAALFEQVKDVDALVSCAGSARFKPLDQLGDEDFAYSLQSKLIGQVNLVRAALRHLRDGGTGFQIDLNHTTTARRIQARGVRAADAQGRTMLPSVVRYLGDGRRQIGHDAAADGRGSHRPRRLRPVQAGRNFGSFVPFPESTKSTTTGMPTFRSSFSQPMTLQVMRGPSGSWMTLTL